MFAITPYVGRRGRTSLVERPDLMKDIDTFFDNMLWAPDLAGFRYPRGVGIYERDNKLFVEIEAPGIKSDDVELRVSRDKLSIKCDDKAESEQRDGDGKTWHMVQSSSRCLNFEIDLPVEIDSDKAEASFSNGVITVSAPRSDLSESKVVKIVDNK